MSTDEDSKREIREIVNRAVRDIQTTQSFKKVADGDAKGTRTKQASGEAADTSDTTLGTPSTSKLVVDGKEITREIAGIEFSQYVDDHHVLRLRLHNVGLFEGGKDIGDELPYSKFLGKSVSLTITPEGEQVDQSRALSFVGTVTNVDMDYSIHGLSFDTITVHSPTISMDGARQNAFYRDQSASDIIGAILRDYPITLGTVESTEGTLLFSVQHRETDYAYVMRLATGSGKFAFYDGQEFRVVKAASSDVEELVWRESLGAFTMGLGTASAEFTSQIYNYEQKKNYGQDTKSLTQQAALSNLSKLSPKASKEVYKKSGFSTSPKVVADAQSLDKILQKDKSRALDRMVNCAGQSNIPAVAAGHCVTIKGMNTLDATYWVTAVHHTVDETGSYHNTFECTPLDIAYPQGKSARASLTNLQSAEVVDNNDPQGLGRVKVKFPWLESDETIWVRVLMPHAGADRGWYSVPEIGDEVLIGFEFGSPDHPIALGALYNKDSAPPSDAVDQEDNIKLMKTKSGNQIKISDKSGEEEIAISTKEGENAIVLNMSGPSISIKSSGDISLKAANIAIESDKETTIKSGTDMKVESGANHETKATGNVKVEGAQVDLKGQGPVNVKGAVINLN
jgi:Rhs element Vgr protein